jgi:hypothetical protein
MRRWSRLVTRSRGRSVRGRAYSSRARSQSAGPFALAARASGERALVYAGHSAPGTVGGRNGYRRASA